MINKEARRAAATILEKISSERLTNYQLEDDWPAKSADRIVDELPDIIWCNYDDTPEQLLTPGHFGESGHDFINRIILFLKSDQEYRWPEWNPPSFRTFFRRLFRLQTADHERELFAQHGDFNVWPFLRKEDFEESKRREDAR